MADGDFTTVEAVKVQVETISAALDAKIEALITPASAAIRSYTGREFVGPAAPEERDIDVGDLGDVVGEEIPVGDLAGVPSSVVVVDDQGATVATLNATTDLSYLPAYRAAGQPIERVRLRSAAPTALADHWVLRITAEWGWPAVPADVEQACIVTVRSWLRTDSASSASFESDIEGRIVQATPEGGWMLPIAAKQMLRPYRRWGVA